MALTPQVIDIPFEGGLDTQTDPKKVVPGKLLELENAVFVGGSIELRPGTAAMADSVVGGATLTTALGLATRGTEMLRWTTGGVYATSATTAGQWTRRADAVEARPLLYDITKTVQRGRSALNFDMASTMGLTAYAWCEVNPAPSGSTTGERNVRVSLVDDVTGTKYHDATLIFSETTTGGTQSTPIQVRVLASGGQFLVLYVSGAISPGVITLNCAKLPVTSPVGTWTPTALATTIARDFSKDYPYTFDAIDVTAGVPAASTTGAFVLAYGAGDGVRTSFITTDPSSPTTYSYLGETLRVPQTGSAAATQYQDVRLARLADLTRVFTLFTQTNTGRLEVHSFNTSTRAAVGAGDLGPHVTGRVCFLEQAPGTVTTYIERLGEASVAPLTQASFTGSASTTSQISVAYGLRLMSDGFLVNGAWLVACATMNIWSNGAAGPDLPGVQPTIVLLDAATGRVVARALVGQAGVPFLGSPLLHRPVERTDGSVSLVVPVRGTLVFNTSTGVLVDETPFGLARMNVRAMDVDRVPRNHHQLLHVGGACPVVYDGGSWVEDGFNYRPEGVSVASSGSTGGLSAGLYSWVVCYEWVDGAGQVHRSAPSPPVSLTSTGTLADSGAVLKIPWMSISRRRGITIVVYRTVANGAIYYRVGASKDAIQNGDPGVVPSSGTLSLTDLVSDANINTNSILPYSGVGGGSVGGELFHVPTSGYSSICRHKDYLVINSMDDGYMYASTLPLVAGQAPAWPVELQYRIPTTHGKIVGIASLENVFVLLAERGCYLVEGEGPGASGDGGFSEPQYITGSVGCIAESSIAVAPEGIWYQAADGFYLLTRGFESQKAGAAVDVYSRLSVSRALEVQVPASTDNPSGRREMRWYTRDGITLVFSSTYQQWSVWTGQPARGAVSFSGRVYFADGSVVRVEDATLQTEAGASFSALVGTAWLKFDGLQGVQRVWKVHLLGQSLVTVTVTAQVYYDYDDVTLGSTQTATFPGFSVGGPRAFEIRQTMARQRAEAVRLRWLFQPAPTAAGDKGRIRLTAMSAEVGVERALYKRRAASMGP